MDDFNDMMMGQPPTAARPLLGLTVLVVEDKIGRASCRERVCRYV